MDLIKQYPDSIELFIGCAMKILKKILLVVNDEFHCKTNIFYKI
jgi:hypothetical protein